MQGEREAAPCRGCGDAVPDAMVTAPRLRRSERTAVALPGRHDAVAPGERSFPSRIRPQESGASPQTGQESGTSCPTETLRMRRASETVTVPEPLMSQRQSTHSARPVAARRA